MLRPHILASSFRSSCLHAQLPQLADNIRECRTLAGLCRHAPAGHSSTLGKTACVVGPALAEAEVQQLKQCIDSSQRTVSLKVSLDWTTKHSQHNAAEDASCYAALKVAPTSDRKMLAISHSRLTAAEDLQRET